MSKLEEFKTKYPDIYKAIHDLGHTAGYAEGEAAGILQGAETGREQAMADGAAAERARIQAVEDQLIPGHEALIADLKADGQTTGEQAAVKVLQAEKALRSATAEKLEADGIKPLVHVQAPDEGVEPGKDFEQLVTDYMAENKCKKSKAISAIAASHPVEHAQFIKSVNKGEK